MIVVYLHTGHAYRVSDALTVQQVNDAVSQTLNRFIEVPLHPDGATVPGTPGVGQTITHLFLTPDSVSHFVVV